jgi:hypothetical protein
MATTYPLTANLWGHEIPGRLWAAIRLRVASARAIIVALCIRI